MKKIYLPAALIFAATTLFNAANAQTHYGLGAGTNGINHSFFGFHAGKINNGKDNTFVGYVAGQVNDYGDFNTFLGTRAGALNSDGSGNTFLGQETGAYNTKGYDNTFVGRHAGHKSTVGYQNTFIGLGAGFYNATGVGNTSIGYKAGFSNTTNYNTFLGFNAGSKNFNGGNNTFLGVNAGAENTSGQYNTYVGNNAGQGTGQGSDNAFFGHSAGQNLLTGNNNTFLGNWAGSGSKSGSDNTYLGYGAGAGAENLNNTTAIGSMAKVSKSNSIVLGNNANVGIGVSAPSYQLHLSSSSATKVGSSTWTVASDQRLKKDVSDYTDGLAVLKQVKPVWFTYNGQAGIADTRKFVGIIAQDMQKIAPYMVGSFTYQDSLGNKSEYLDYDANAVTYMLVNSVKEQQQLIEEKDAKIQSLADRLEKVEKLVATLTSKPLNANAAARENAASIEQNVPNGFTDKTSIKYFVPDHVKNAVISIYTLDGKQLESHIISKRGAGELIIPAGRLNSGALIYDLITDGKNAGAKKMIVNK